MPPKKPELVSPPWLGNAVVREGVPRPDPLQLAETAGEDHPDPSRGYAVIDLLLGAIAGFAFGLVIGLAFR